MRLLITRKKNSSRMPIKYKVRPEGNVGQKEIGERRKI